MERVRERELRAHRATSPPSFLSLSLFLVLDPIILTSAYMCLVSSTASGANDTRLPMDLRGRLLAAWCWRNWMAPSLSFAADAAAVVVVAAFATSETDVPPLWLSSPGAERLRDCCV